MQQLNQYLDYYCSLTDPGYAVLVTGDWGSGKTTQVKACLHEDRIYYISLFGLRKAEDITSAVYAAMYPIKAKMRQAADIGSEMSVDAGVLASIPVGAIAAGIAKAFLRDAVKADRTIVFDDLERCSAPLNDTLGVINNYVEHHRCRVVIIAHDKEVVGKFATTKEKLIGQTISISPQINEAFSSFIGRFSADHRALLGQHKDDMIEIFKQSEVRSLRILRHVLEDNIRLLKLLNDHQRDNHDAMAELVRLFSALNIEIRSNRVSARDIYRRATVEMKYAFRKNKKETARKPPLISAGERYPSVDLTSRTLRDDVIVDTLFSGMYNQRDIQDSLANSFHFKGPEELPAWRNFLEYRRHPAEIGEAAFESLKRQFETGDIEEPGEMLHLFALRFLMSEKQLISDDLDNVTTQCLELIDKKLAEGALQPLSLDGGSEFELSNGYQGYGFHVEDSYLERFHIVQRHLRTARQIALERSLPIYSPLILEALLKDSGEFYRLLNHTNSTTAKFSKVPVLNCIPPAQFVETMLRSDPQGWNTIKNALQRRYEDGQLQYLDDERKWLDEVRARLSEAAASTTPIHRLQILAALPVPLAEEDPS